MWTINIESGSSMPEKVYVKKWDGSIPICSKNILGGVTRIKPSAVSTAPVMPSNGHGTSGLRGGNGTSQPHFTNPPTIPAIIPIKIESFTLRSEGFEKIKFDWHKILL